MIQWFDINYIRLFQFDEHMQRGWTRMRQLISIYVCLVYFFDSMLLSNVTLIVWELGSDESIQDHLSHF